MINNFPYKDLYELLDKAHDIKDIHDDITQFQANINALNNANNYYSGQPNNNKIEVEKCLKDTNEKYGLYAKWYNCLQGGINYKNTYTPYEQMPFLDIVQQLSLHTQKIPAYIFLREGWNNELKGYFKRFVCLDIDDNAIYDVRRSIK